MIFEDRGIKSGFIVAVIIILAGIELEAKTVISNKNNDIIFDTQLVKRIDYVYNNDGEPLKHHIDVMHGKGGGFDADEQLIDRGGIIVLKISRAGKTVLSKELPRWCGLSEDSYSIVDPTKSSSDKQIVARDINNDGLPELILCYDNGSAHGDIGCSIFQLNGSRPAKEIYKANLPFPEFEDIDKDGIYEITVTDNTFSYWKDSAYCQYSGEKVVLPLQNGTYRASCKYTFTPTPSRSEFNAILKELKGEIDKFKSKCKPGTAVMTPVTWKPLISLIYSGNAQTAIKALEAAYAGQTKLIVTANPDNNLEGSQIESKQQFWTDMVKQAKTSPYTKWLFYNLN